MAGALAGRRRRRRVSCCIAVGSCCAQAVGGAGVGRVCGVPAPSWGPWGLPWPGAVLPSLPAQLLWLLHPGAPASHSPCV